MANEEHLKILGQGVKVWNQWRKENPAVIPDLREENLSGKALSGIDLANVDLTGAILRTTNLEQSIIHDAQLGYSTLHYSFLSDANFRGADLIGANLSSAIANNADFSHSNLSDAILDTTSLISANFTGANLKGTILKQSFLKQANFTDAVLDHTLFGNTFLSNTTGLDKCKHHGPSQLDLETIATNWPLPKEFLRGVGFPESYIDYLPNLLNQPIKYYSCFISYSFKDQEFAEKLYHDLQERGVRCWFAPKDLKIGDKLQKEIFGAIKKNDKVLLILSKASLESTWVEDEVDTAFGMEKRKGVPILYPVMIDDMIMSSDHYWAEKLRNERLIGSFSQWKNEKIYRESFNGLLKGLAFTKTQ